MGFTLRPALSGMAVMFAHSGAPRLNEINQTRLLLLSLFWHFLDIIWIGVFSIVYLMGAAS